MRQACILNRVRLCFAESSQNTGRIHALMQYAYHGDTVCCHAKVDDMLFNT